MKGFYHDLKIKSLRLVLPIAHPINQLIAVLYVG